MFISQAQTLQGHEDVSVSSMVQLLILIPSMLLFVHNHVALGAAYLLTVRLYCLSGWISAQLNAKFGGGLLTWHDCKLVLKP